MISGCLIPETDYMIRMLPEGFFYDMALRISEGITAGAGSYGSYCSLLKNMIKSQRNRKTEKRIEMKI